MIEAEIRPISGLNSSDAASNWKYAEAIGVIELISSILIEALKYEGGLTAPIEPDAEEFSGVISRLYDPIVYVRDYCETNVEVFHASLANRHTSRTRPVRLSEAVASGLRPCAWCGDRFEGPDAYGLAA